MKTPTEQLIEYLKQDRVIPVVGVEVSRAVAGLPGWAGLLEKGFAYAETRKLGENRIEEGLLLLKDWKLTEAASILKDVLNAPRLCSAR